MEKRLKVAYFLGSLNRGGLETLLLDVFRNAAEADYDFIGIYRKPGLLEEAFLNTGVSMYRLRPGNVLDIAYFRKVRQILRKDNVSIVHAQTPLDALIALVVTVGMGIKVVITYHSTGLSKERRTQFVMNHVDLNLYVSKYQKSRYFDIYKMKDSIKHKVIHNGISFDKFSVPVKKECCKTRALIFGTVGSFSSGRSQKIICRFLKKLKDQGVEFKFYFVGSKTKAEPYLYEDCVRYCEENQLTDSVCFMGTRNDVPQLLQQWDAYIYSTVHDSFGISVIEAVASGLPTFVNDWPVMEEITAGGAYATLYKSNDADDLLEKFTDFLNDRESYAQRALAAAAEVRNRYNIKEYIRNLSDSYRTLI